MWVGDPRSGIQETDPWVKKAPDPGSATLEEYDCCDNTRTLKCNLCNCHQFADLSHTVPLEFQRFAAREWNNTSTQCNRFLGDLLSTDIRRISKTINDFISVCLA
jgi:hypothetical protein